MRTSGYNTTLWKTENLNGSSKIENLCNRKKGKELLISERERVFKKQGYSAIQ